MVDLYRRKRGRRCLARVFARKAEWSPSCGRERGRAGRSCGRLGAVLKVRAIVVVRLLVVHESGQSFGNHNLSSRESTPPSGTSRILTSSQPPSGASPRGGLHTKRMTEQDVTLHPRSVRGACMSSGFPDSATNREEWINPSCVMTREAWCERMRLMGRCRCSSPGGFSKIRVMSCCRPADPHLPNHPRYSSRASHEPLPRSAGRGDSIDGDVNVPLHADEVRTVAQVSSSTTSSRRSYAAT